MIQNHIKNPYDIYYTVRTRMIYEADEIDEQIMRTHFDEFKCTVKGFYTNILREYERIKHDKGLLRVFKHRHPFFNKDDLNRREYIHEMFKYQEFSRFRDIPKFVIVFFYLQSG